MNVGCRVTVMSSKTITINHHRPAVQAMRSSGRRMFSNAGIPPPPPERPRNSTKGVLYRNMLLLGGLGVAIGWGVSEFLAVDEKMVPRKHQFDDLAEVQSEVTHRVFLDVQLPSLEAGGVPTTERIIIGLYGKECPNTARNFLGLCEGFEKTTPHEKRKLSYENCKFHRVIPGFMLQSGDFTHHDGTGGESIFSTRSFADESFKLKHTGLGILSMANRGKDTNTSQFFICLDQCAWLDGRHVVFGQVLNGVSTLRRIESYGSKSGKVSQEIKIVKCGVLPKLEESITMTVDPNEVLDETGRNANRIMK